MIYDKFKSLKFSNVHIHKFALALTHLGSKETIPCFTLHFIYTAQHNEILLFIGSLSYSQINTPRFSAATEIKQTVGLTEVKLEYSRPSMRDRQIFGNCTKAQT